MYSLTLFGIEVKKVWRTSTEQL